MEEDDRQLVARLLAGDERAFKEFFDEYFDRLYRFAMSRTRGDAGFAEEAAQRALIRAVRRLDGFRGESSLFTWLARICRNELADMGEIAARDSARNVSLDGSEHVRLEAESVAARSDAGPGQERDAADTARLVREVLDELPGRYGEVLEWKYFEDLGVDEIARRLRTTFPAAQSMLQRARGAFRSALEARGIDPSVLGS